MKPGDLVELSSYGEKLKFLSPLVGVLGLVVSIDGPKGTWGVNVVWCGLQGRHDLRQLTRKDVRIVKQRHASVTQLAE